MMTVMPRCDGCRTHYLIHVNNGHGIETKKLSDATVTAKGASGAPEGVGADKHREHDDLRPGFVCLLVPTSTRISFTVRRSGSEQPVVVDFKYDHRR